MLLPAAALAFFLLGLYALWLGVQRLRQPDPRRVALAPTESAALWLARVFQGEQQAQQWRKTFMQRDRLRRFGVLYLISGGVMTLAGLIQAAAWLALR